MRVRWLLVCAALACFPANSLSVLGQDKTPPKVATANAPVKLAHGGTYIHVRNGTTRALDFTLFVECAAGGTGKFDKQFKLKPGDTAVWRLDAVHVVSTSHEKGTVYYRLGLVGKDPANGKEHRWGLIGGPGMYGKERHSIDEASASSSRHIHVQPIGDI